MAQYNRRVHNILYHLLKNCKMRMYEQVQVYSLYFKLTKRPYTAMVIKKAAKKVSVAILH